MDDQLKELMQELGNAINESLSDSERIAAAIGEIRRAGYDVFLVLEATIGFNRREDDNTEDPSREELRLESAEERTPRRRARRSARSSKFRFTAQDEQFLRQLRIAMDEDPRP